MRWWRVDRRDGDPVLANAEEELVVECAYTVCGSLGLDTSGSSIPYLDSWSEWRHWRRSSGSRT